MKRLMLVVCLIAATAPALDYYDQPWVPDQFDVTEPLFLGEVAGARFVLKKVSLTGERLVFALSLVRGDEAFVVGSATAEFARPPHWWWGVVAPDGDHFAVMIGGEEFPFTPNLLVYRIDGDSIRLVRRTFVDSVYCSHYLRFVGDRLYHTLVPFEGSLRRMDLDTGGFAVVVETGIVQITPDGYGVLWAEPRGVNAEALARWLEEEPDAEVELYPTHYWPEQKEELITGYVRMNLFDTRTDLGGPAWSASASGALSEDETVHGAANAVDGDIATAWVEGAEGPGIGETLRLDFGAPTLVENLVLLPGYFAGPDLWRANNRLKEVLVRCSDGREFRWELVDEPRYQHLDLTAGVEESVLEWVELEIVAVHPGALYDDTCISEITINLGVS
jgi:hypothetical protein